VRPLGETLAAEGFTVAGQRLAGHGTAMEDHAKTGARDWIRSIEEDLAWLEGRCDNIFFAGGRYRSVVRAREQKAGKAEPALRVDPTAAVILEFAGQTRSRRRAYRITPSSSGPFSFC
jgi:hypothetical protein